MVENAPLTDSVWPPGTRLPPTFTPPLMMRFAARLVGLFAKVTAVAAVMTGVDADTGAVLVENVMSPAAQCVRGSVRVPVIVAPPVPVRAPAVSVTLLAMNELSAVTPAVLVMIRLPMIELVGFAIEKFCATLLLRISVCAGPALYEVATGPVWEKLLPTLSVPAVSLPVSSPPANDAPPVVVSVLPAWFMMITAVPAVEMPLVLIDTTWPLMSTDPLCTWRLAAMSAPVTVYGPCT